MEPIISPWFVYALGVVDSFGEASVGLCIGSGAIFVLWAGITAGMMAEGSLEAEQGKKSLKLSTIPLVLFFVSMFFSLLLPSSKTLMAMYAASLSTPDNIRVVTDAGKSFKDEIKQDILDILEHGIDKKNLDK